MGIVPLLLLILLIAAVVWLVRSASRTGGTQPFSTPRSPGLDALEERYARDEIGRDEFLQKKKDILG